MQMINGQLGALLQRIVDDMTRLYPCGQFELHMHARGSKEYRHIKEGTACVAQELVEFCSKFPSALVRYSPGDAYGCISTIVCDCTGAPNTCPTKCCSVAERPRAFLLLVNDGERDVLLGKYEPPRIRQKKGRQPATPTSQTV